MSEYMERHNIAKLIGSPPGYIGHEEGGQLTEAIRRRPYSVVLFDEIEKAHPDAFNIMLQILDDGRLTDAKGRVVNFKNTIIIMTSNLGNQLIQEYSIGFTEAANKASQKKTREKEMNEEIIKILRDNFKLEFLNRIDEIIIFHSLSEENIKQIVELRLKELSDRLALKKIKISVAEAAKKFLARRGYDPVFGARPLKRVIQRHILDEIALRIIEGKIKAGDTIKIDFKKDKLLIEVE